MTNANVLTQYQSEVIEALKSVANLGKPFEKVIIDTLKLFMAIPDKINFLQMGRYGEFAEQTYRNTFTRDDFDWFSFNLFLANKVCTGKYRAIAVDPSFIPKAGNKMRIIFPAAVRISTVRKLSELSTGPVLAFAFPDVLAGGIIGETNSPPGRNWTKAPGSEDRSSS